MADLPEAKLVLTVRVRLAWWWPLYSNGIVVMVWLTGLEPDLARVHAAARRAVRVSIIEVGREAEKPKGWGWPRT